MWARGVPERSTDSLRAQAGRRTPPGPHRVGLAVTVTRVRAVPPRGAFFHTRVGPPFSKGHAPARARGAGSDAAGPHGGTTRTIDGTPAAAYTG